MLAAVFLVPYLASASVWPDLSHPPKAVGGGGKDAAVIVGVEKYAFVEGIPGARQNAEDWHAYLTDTLKVPAHRVALLRNEEATLELMRRSAARAASEVKAGGTLWFVFIGHGAPSEDGKDGMLIGVDAQQRADSLYARSLARNELLGLLSKGKQGRTVVLVDACFSGKSTSGQALVKGLQPLVTMAGTPGPLDNRTILMTAARADQFAGPLPKSSPSRPAFSYLALGGLRGWAADEGGKVTASGLIDYIAKVLRLAKDRTQTPELAAGDGKALLGMGRERAPDLGRIDREGGAGTIRFEVSALPAVPRANAPAMVGAGRVPRADLPEEIGKLEGIDFGSVNIAALEKYDAAVKFEKGGASAEAKAAKWRELGREVASYGGLSAKRAAAWDEYAAQAAFAAVSEKDKGELSAEAKRAAWLELGKKYPRYAQAAQERAAEWERYAQELAAAEEARRKRAEIRDQDWSKLSRLLALSVVGAADKKKFAETFVKAYGKTLAENPHVIRLEKHLPAGTVVLSPADRRAAAIGIEWVTIPGGSFMMGSNSGSSDEKPVHRVSVRTFQMAKTEVTNAQYRACVQAGACAPPDDSCGEKLWGDDQPVVCVDWGQASTFAKWSGGRLPSEAEWEYAARSGGRDIEYPWGNETPSCARAVMTDGGTGCGRDATWPVCSKTMGNTSHGLCDMSGNVWEWTQDWYHSSYNGAPIDGSAWERPTGSYRVYRGGSRYYVAAGARSAFRGSIVPGYRYDGLGFRPAR